MYFLRRLMFWRRKWWIGRTFADMHVTVRCDRRGLFELYDGPYFSHADAFKAAEVWAKYLKMEVGE